MKPETFDQNLTLYRRRLIPDELVRLDDDVIVYRDDKMIITRWKVLHPKANLTHGISCYFLNDGVKVSKFYNQEHFKFWYCDIIRTEIDEANHCITFVDLLTDVIIHPDGMVKVVDLDELSDAVEQGLLTQEELLTNLRTTDQLLRTIYKGQFMTKIEKLEELDKEGESL